MPIAGRLYAGSLGVCNQILALETWKEKLSDVLIQIAESTGLHIVDFFAILFLPMLYFSAKKYFNKAVEISLTDKIYDATFFLVAIMVYIFFFLNLFGIFTY